MLMLIVMVENGLRCGLHVKMVESTQSLKLEEYGLLLLLLKMVVVA
jgi:hypothetical protein